MPLDLSPAKAAAMEEVLRAMRDSNVPLRRPSFSNPTFWSRPLISTIAVPLAADTVWSDILTVNGLSGYSGMVTGYVATAYGDTSLAATRFRIIYNGSHVDTVDFVSSVERNRESATLFPTFPQATFFNLLSDKDSLTIQAINDGTFQQLVLCAFYGWYYDNSNQAERGSLGELTDA